MLPAYENNSAGFSLIEMILVLVLVALLSAAIFPKYYDMKQHARIIAVESVASNLESTSTIYWAVAIKEQLTTGYMDVDGNNVEFDSGYLEGHWNNAFRYVLEISAQDSYTNPSSQCDNGYSLCGVGNRDSIPDVPSLSGGKGVIVWLEGDYIADECYAYYYNPHTGATPTIGVVTDGC